MRRIDAQIVDFTEHHYSVAAEAYLRFGRGVHPQAGLNYGDCLAYAVAALAGDSLLFVGEGFKRTDVPAAQARKIWQYQYYSCQRTYGICAEKVVNYKP